MSRNTNTTDRNRSGSRQSTSKRTSAPKRNINSILIIVLSIVVIISIVAGVVTSLGRKSSDTVADDSTTAEKNVTVIENKNELQMNKYPEVNELIANYRKAFQNSDTELLKQVYNSDTDINVDILKATSQIIEAYENTQCYTKRGLNSGEYVTFVYDDLKLSGIETKAPNLSVFYIKTAEDDSLYIYRGEYNAATESYEYGEDIQNYINSLYSESDVSELINTVNTQMDSACANDEKLMAFMERVRNRTNVETEANETPETESAQTESAETESAQTETAESETETGEEGE